MQRDSKGQGNANRHSRGTKARVYWTSCKHTRKVKDYILTPPAQLKYTSLTKIIINYLQLRKQIVLSRVTGGSIHCIAPRGQAGQGQADRGDRTTEVTGHQAQRQSTACFHANGGWRPLAAACPQVRCHCPSSPSRPPRLLFLGLSLGIVCAAIVRGRLAKSPDALQSTCQLQQQGNELEREGQCEREGCGDTGGPHSSTPPSIGTAPTHDVLRGGRQFRVRQALYSEGQQRRGSSLWEQHTPRIFQVQGSGEMLCLQP